MKKRLSIGLMLGLVALVWTEAQVLVQTGHTAAVRDLAVHRESRIIATASEDGTVKVWNESGRLLGRLQIGPFPIVSVTIHESGDILALVEERGSTAYRVSVWNWRRSRELYSATEAAPVTHIAFSPRGRYLVYSVSDIRSLRFLDVQSGRRLSLVDLSFGVVTFFAVAGSESNIMTYAPATGEVFYFDLDSGRRIESLRIPSQVRDIALLPSRRYVAGLFRDELIVVDIVDGDIEARTTVGDVTGIAVNPDSGAIAVMAASGELTGYRFTRGDLTPLYWSAEAPDWSPQAFAFSGARLFAGTTRGEVDYLPFGGDAPVALAEGIVDAVSSVVGHEDSLYVATSNSLFSLSSRLVMNGDISDSGDSIRYNRVANPVGSRTHLSVSDDGTLLAWKSNGNGAALFDVSGLSGKGRAVSDVEQGVRSVTVGSNGFLVVQADGTVVSLDENRLAGDTLYSAVGVEVAVQLAGNRVVVGKARSDTFDSALVQVDIQTGETVSLPTEAFLAYRLAVAPNKRILYAIELVRQGDSTRTVLTRYSGPSFERRTVLARRNEEILDALLLVAPNDGRLISNLPDGELAEYDGRRWLPFETARTFPTSAAVYGGLLVAAGSDGTVTAWDRASRRLRYTLTVFGDGEWVVFSENRRFVPSEDSVLARLTTTETRLGRLPDAERYRLDVRVRRQ